MQELSVGRSVKHSKGPSTYSVQVKEKDLIYCWSWMLFSSSTLCQCVPVRHVNQHFELRSLLPLSPGHPSVPQGKACSRAAMMQTLNDFVGADMGDVDRYVLKQGSTMVGGISRTVPKRPMVPSREQTKIPPRVADDYIRRARRRPRVTESSRRRNRRAGTDSATGLVRSHCSKQLLHGTGRRNRLYKSY